MLPGRAYTVHHPALHYVAAAARELGWVVEVVDWKFDAKSEDEVLQPGFDAVQRLPRQGSVVIGKSLGSALLPAVAERGLPAVWLTPLLQQATIRRAASRGDAPALLVGGTADPTWDSQFAHATGHEVLELEGGDHGLVIPDDAVSSARFLVTLTTRASAFFTGLA